ncbi:Mitochondrial 54S ribosomal protein L6 [Lachnellula suecica]|uniref:Mitochondrial 54S ribosomal protein L6 n=1 Tax=Lachnellula suecica TaxID=602035 RepID=A0A8T9CN98_9HELO|nr:Mitochondrial 54S ribosomal protein L6 [Lachnellula suecica]
MLSTARSKGLERATTSTPSASIPAFLLPAFPIASSRSFSSSTPRASQIGKAALSIPPGVEFNVLPPPARKNGYFSPIVAKETVQIEGPLGKMSMTIPPFVKLQHDTATRKAYVSVDDKEVKKQREMWGTVRAYLQNHILGVSEGHTAILRLVGVGYRATIENNATTVQAEFPGQQFVALKVGYSHPIELPVPKGVKASVPQPTRILLEGVEKEVILQAFLSTGRRSS